MQTKRIASKVWLVVVNAFWIAVWLPGRLQSLKGRDPLRWEDVISVVAFALGIALELRDSWAARFFNVWFYVGYSILIRVLFARDRSDAHSMNSKP